MSRESLSRRYEQAADLCFLAGIIALFLAVLIFATNTGNLVL